MLSNRSSRDVVLANRSMRSYATVSFDVARVDRASGCGPGPVAYPEIGLGRTQMVIRARTSNGAARLLSHVLAVARVSLGEVQERLDGTLVCRVPVSCVIGVASLVADLAGESTSNTYSPDGLGSRRSSS